MKTLILVIVLCVGQCRSKGHRRRIYSPDDLIITPNRPWDTFNGGDGRQYDIGDPDAIDVVKPPPAFPWYIDYNYGRQYYPNDQFFISNDSWDLKKRRRPFSRRTTLRFWSDNMLPHIIAKLESLKSVLDNYGWTILSSIVDHWISALKVRLNDPKLESESDPESEEQPELEFQSEMEPDSSLERKPEPELELEPQAPVDDVNEYYERYFGRMSEPCRPYDRRRNCMYPPPYHG